VSLRGPLVFGILGIVAGLAGWFLLGSSIALGVLRWQRCGDRPAISADPACHGAIPWEGRARLGAGLLLVGAAGLGTAALLAVVRGGRTRHRRSAR
jgi:hypothetical protein